jgi:integrase
MKKVRIPVPRTPGVYRIKYRDQGGKLHDPIRGLPFEARYSVEESGKSVTKSMGCESIPTGKSIHANGPKPKAEKGSDIAFRDVVEHWKKHKFPRLSRSTINTYSFCLRHLEYFFQFERTGEIEARHIREWLTLILDPVYIAGQKSTRMTYRHEWIVLKSIIGHYRENFNNSYSLPFLKSHRADLQFREVLREDKDLSLGEFNAVLKALKESSSGENEVFYYLAIFQYGIYGRVQEAAALHFEDFSDTTVRVHRKIEWLRRKGQKAILSSGSKSNAGKEIPLSPFLKKHLKEWTVKSGRRRGLLFQFRGEMLTYRRIQYRYDQAFRKAGVRFTGTHLLRHASLTEVYHQSKDIKTTAHLAGHSNIATTERYAKARDVQAREAQERMSRELTAAME